MSGKLQPDVESALLALKPVSSGLAADGYALEVNRTDSGSLVVEIVAGPGAFEECLIPREMFAGMLSSRLSAEGMDFSDLVLVYPADRFD